MFLIGIKYQNTIPALLGSTAWSEFLDPTVKIAEALNAVKKRTGWPKTGASCEAATMKSDKDVVTMAEHQAGSSQDGSVTAAEAMGISRNREIIV